MLTNVVCALFTIAWRSLWKDAGILHRDISSGNILVSRRDDTLVGIPIDLDHAIHVKDSKDPSGKPQEKSPTSKHRTGTAPFMALDLLVPPRPSDHPNFPTWHLPRFDMESFIWVFCWTLHHFKLGKKRNGEAYRKWKAAKEFDQAFNGDNRAAVRAKKWQWASSLPTMDEIDPSFNPLKPLMKSLVQVIVTAYVYQEAQLLKSKRSNKVDFVEMGGRFVIDKVIAMIEDFLESL